MNDFLSQMAIKNQHLIQFILESGKPIKIELGSSQKRMEGWLTMDLDPNSDLCMDLSKPLPFPDNCVEEIYSSHLLEHFSFPYPMLNLLSECYRVLKPGGIFKIAVPDARIYIESYEKPDQFDPEKYCLYTPAYHYHSKIDFINYIAYMDGHHRYLFDNENLPIIIANVGFENVKLREFEPGLDLETRKHESIYAEARKPGVSHPLQNLSELDQKPQLKTPVCLMIFNRPDTTQQVFNAIRQVKPEKLLVIADGPRPNVNGEFQKCAATRAIINQVDWECEVLTHYSDINLGCRHRVSSGLNWVFNTVEEAIILEDDCLPDVTFFRFCEELLERYRHDERIMMISGDNFQFGQNHQETSYYFSRYNHIWGWATWRRAWKFYDLDMKLWPTIRDNNRLQSILENPQVVAYWSRIFQDAYEGFNTWDYAWAFACWINDGLTILPNVNLVSNIGFREDATHTIGESQLANLPTKAMNFPLKHPTDIIRNRQADDWTEAIIFSCTASPTQTQLNQDGIILLSQGIEYLNQYKNVEALNIFKKVLEIAPHQTGIYYAKAIAEARLGKIIDSIESLKSLLRIQPNHQKAQILLKQIRPGKAGELLEKAANALREDQIDIAFNILNEAKALRERVIGLDYLRANCFMRMNMPSASVQSLYEELRYFPNNHEAQSQLNEILEQYPQFRASQIDDSEFHQLLEIVRPYTMLSEARLYSLFTLAKGICINNIPGNFVECGVAAGGSTALLATVIQRYSKQPRLLYAFDSFEGMPTPTEADKSYGIPADLTGWGTGTCAAPETSTHEICSKLGVLNLVQTVKGYFQDTLPQMRNQVGMIALLHMDGDWYESTQTILNNFYDRVSNQGVIQVDDYGHWEGCRQALHEFETEHQLKFEINPIDDTGIWFPCPNQFPINSVFEQQLIEEFNEDDPIVYGIQSQMSKNERFQLYYVLRKLLPEFSQPLRFIEIGSFAGSSLFLTCKALNRLTSNLQGFAIDPGLHPQLKLVLQEVKQNVTHLQVFSHDAVIQLQRKFEQDGNFPPFIFVDGDHSYEGVKQDIINYYPLLKPGGIMMFHDYLPALNDENRSAILSHHGGNEPGIRQACQELMEETYHCELIDIPLLYPTDPTQTQAYLPIIPGVFSTIRVYRKSIN